MTEGTNLVAVASSATFIIAGKQKTKKKTFQLRDISKMKRADAWEGDCSDDSNYSYDEETHTLHRRLSPVAREKPEEVKPLDEDFFSGDDTPVMSTDELYAQLGSVGPPETSKRKNKILKAAESSVYAKWSEAVGSLAKPPKPLAKCQYVPEMEVAAETSIRHSMKGGAIPWVRTAIVGPKGSGKSTFLSVYLKTLAQKMSRNGSCKSSFFLFLDLAQASFESTQSIYTFLVTETLTQMGEQEPKLKPVAGKMAQYFCGIPSGKSPLIFPKRIPVDSAYPYVDTKLTKLSKRIKSLSDGDPSKFLKFIFKFPIEIGKIFDVKTVFYVIDHFELSDDTIMTENISEILKLVLHDLPFVVCCKNEQKMLTVLKSLSDERTNIDRIVTFLNISDIKVPPPVMGHEFLVGFDKSQTIRLKRGHCGGCVAFLAEWDRLVKFATKLHEWEQKHGKVKPPGTICDNHVRCVDKMRVFLKKILSEEEYPEGRIVTVRLIKCMP